VSALEVETALREHSEIEVAAVAASEGFALLRAPVLRITAPFAPVPLPPALQAAYYPQPEGIAERVAALL
jgi:acetoin:2,6-dichlorophenolindophenol oxidoreductase subunit beta